MFIFSQFLPLFMQLGIAIQRFKNIVVQQRQFLITQLLGGLSQSTIVLYLDAIEQWTRWRAPNALAGLFYLQRLAGRITRSTSHTLTFCWLSPQSLWSISVFVLSCGVLLSQTQQSLSFLLYRLKNGKQVEKISILISRLIGLHFCLDFLTLGLLVDSPETPLSGTYASGMNTLKKVAFALYTNYVAIKFLNPKADEKSNSHTI